MASSSTGIGFLQIINSESSENLQTGFYEYADHESSISSTLQWSDWSILVDNSIIDFCETASESSENLQAKISEHADHESNIVLTLC